MNSENLVYKAVSIFLNTIDKLQDKLWDSLVLNIVTVIGFDLGVTRSQPDHNPSYIGE
jgi:hypothetical protein